MKARSWVGLAPRGGGECFSELGFGEVRQRPPVDPLRVGAHGQDEHHVAEIDRLSPW